ALEVLPGVLTIENHRDNGFSPAAPSRVSSPGFEKPRYEVVRRSVGAAARIAEADEVRENVVAKQAGDACASGGDDIRLIKLFRLIRMSFRAARKRRVE